MADAYKLKADTSFPEVIRTSVNIDGVQIEETVGNAYAAGDYVLASSMTPRDRERAANGELDHLLEPASAEDAKAYFDQKAVRTFIPEHEVERYVLFNQDDKRVVERDQALELRSAGAEAAKDALEAARKSGADNRPAITEQPSFVEVPDITTAQSEGESVVPKHDNEPVSEAVLEEQGVELPPGLPVGPTLAKAEGADPAEVDKATEKAAKSAKRSRPGSSSSSGSEGTGD
jgi:hypothetical protein